MKRLKSLKEIGKIGKAMDICGKKRPPRDTLCQLPKGHLGRHRAVIFWED